MMVTNSSCTVYRYNHTIKGYERAFIADVFWQESEKATVSNVGAVTLSGTQIYIPAVYFANAPQTTLKDMLVKGYCSFEFDNTSVATVSKSMTEFRKSSSFVTVTSIEKKLYGTIGLQHIKILAR